MHKKSLETILYSSAGIVVMLVIVIAVNVITGVWPLRADLTQEKAYTLSDGHRAILKKLDTAGENPFILHAKRHRHAGNRLSRRITRARSKTCCRNTNRSPAKNLIIEKYDPQPDSDAEDSAQLDGLEPQQLPGGDNFYLGLAVSAGRRARGDSVSLDRTARDSWNTTSRARSRR